MPPSPTVVVVLVTAPNRRVGEALGRALVEERLAACVNLVPGLTSLYRWEGKLHRDREVLLLIKTRRSRCQRLMTRVVSLHPYTTAEILALPVIAGSGRYLAWVADSTR